MSAQFLTIPRPRFRTPSISSVEQFALDVREGLSRFPKELPSRYLYDEVGSALFDVITLLPEYGLTRADERLLRRNADSAMRSLTELRAQLLPDNQQSAVG